MLRIVKATKIYKKCWRQCLTNQTSHGFPPLRSFEFGFYFSIFNNFYLDKLREIKSKTEHEVRKNAVYRNLHSE